MRRTIGAGLLALGIVLPLSSCQAMGAAAEWLTTPVSGEAGEDGQASGTKGDAIVSAVATAGGAVTGNPMLWGVLGQLGHLLLGQMGSMRRRQTPSAT